MKAARPKVGIMSLTSCEGCQISILDLEDELLDIAEKIDLVNFRLAQEKNLEGPYDIMFVEGSVSSQDNLKMLLAARQHSMMLVALGNCAHTGGVQSLRNFMDKAKAEKEVYGKTTYLKYKEVKAVSECVKVDMVIRGCPIDNREFLDILKKMLIGKIARQMEKNVCTECRLKEKRCLLNKGIACLGPIIYCGCDAICPNKGYVCLGCRGTIKDMNLEAYIRLLRSKGIPQDDIRALMRTFTGRDEMLKDI